MVHLLPIPHEALMVCGVAPLTTYPFGDLEISFPAASTGDIECLEVKPYDRNHPQASAPQQTEKYWQIIATKSSSQPAADYNATMTATVPFTLATADGLCRYLGSGMSWDCAADSFDAAQKKITRQNITQFSDWAAAQAATAGSVFICLSSNDQFPRKL